MAQENKCKKVRRKGGLGVRKERKKAIKVWGIGNSRLYPGMWLATGRRPRST